MRLTPKILTLETGGSLVRGETVLQSIKISKPARTTERDAVSISKQEYK